MNQTLLFLLINFQYFVCLENKLLDHDQWLCAKQHKMHSDVN